MIADMWNPWNKSKEALAEAKRIGGQLEVVSTGKALIEQAHKSLVGEKADLEKEVERLKAEIESKNHELALQDIEMGSLNLKIDSAKKEAEKLTDANGVLSQLAHGRLEKLNSAKSILEAFAPSTSYLKSNKALRVELASAVKTIEEAKAAICPDQVQS